MRNLNIDNVLFIACVSAVGVLLTFATWSVLPSNTKPSYRDQVKETSAIRMKLGKMEYDIKQQKLEGK